MWAEKYYYKQSQTFDGTNCIDDKNIMPYNIENHGKDYEISFEIDTKLNNESQATLMSAMEEITPWPGVLFRYSKPDRYEYDIQDGNNRYKAIFDVKKINKVVIKRVNGKIYISHDDSELIQVADHSTTAYFTTPVSFGCSLKPDLSHQRYYKGTLSNIKAIIYEKQ